MSHGYRNLRLTPWANHAIGTTEGRALDARAVALGASVTAGGEHGRWTVHATSKAGGIMESVYHQPGALAVTIGSVLDDFEQQRDIVAEEIDDLFSPDEIVQIARQSGLVA